MVILVNWVTDFRPQKFHISALLTPCFQSLYCTLVMMRRHTLKEHEVVAVEGDCRICEGMLWCAAGTINVHGNNRLLDCPRINFNAVWIVKTATIIS